VSNTSASPSAGSATAGRSTNTYNIDRFLGQDGLEDGTVYARVSKHAKHPHPKARVSFYKARAASAIAAFNDAFAAPKSGSKGNPWSANQRL
jgi:hypothetical protein